VPVIAGIVWWRWCTARGTGSARRPTRSWRCRCRPCRDGSAPTPHGSRRRCRRRRGRQPGPHVHQHGVHEARMVEIQPTRGVLPAGIKAEPVHRFPVAAALDALQHHHHGHDHRRHTAPTHLGEQVREHCIREQAVTLPMQDPINRSRADPAIAESGRRPKQRPPRRQPQTHRSPRTRNSSRIGSFSRNEPQIRRPPHSFKFHRSIPRT